MAIDFPNAPSPGANFTVNSKTYTFTDSKWQLNVSTGGITGATGPTGPATTTNVVLTSPLEVITTSATAATGTVNFDVKTQALLYYTTSASDNWTLNIRGDSSTTLDSVMGTGQTMTIVFMVTTGVTPYRQTGFTIDGNAVTPKWQFGIAPSSGNASSIDLYTITLIKTGSAAFTVIESLTQFK
jgi:hypothetical protein